MRRLLWVETIPGLMKPLEWHWLLWKEELSGGLLDPTRNLLQETVQKQQLMLRLEVADLGRRNQRLVEWTRASLKMIPRQESKTRPSLRRIRKVRQQESRAR